VGKKEENEVERGGKGRRTKGKELGSGPLAGKRLLDAVIIFRSLGNSCEGWSTSRGRPELKFVEKKTAATRGKDSQFSQKTNSRSNPERKSKKGAKIRKGGNRAMTLFSKTKDFTAKDGGGINRCLAE